MQAFLYDHIQPHMSPFNPQVFKLASSSYLCQHLYHLNEASEDFISQ